MRKVLESGGRCKKHSRGRRHVGSGYVLPYDTVYHYVNMWSAWARPALVRVQKSSIFVTEKYQIRVHTAQTQQGLNQALYSLYRELIILEDYSLFIVHVCFQLATPMPMLLIDTVGIVLSPAAIMFTYSALLEIRYVFLKGLRDFAEDTYYHIFFLDGTYVKLYNGQIVAVIKKPRARLRNNILRESRPDI